MLEAVVLGAQCCAGCWLAGVARCLSLSHTHPHFFFLVGVDDVASSTFCGWMMDCLVLVVRRYRKAVSLNA